MNEEYKKGEEMVTFDEEDLKAILWDMFEKIFYDDNNPKSYMLDYMYDLIINNNDPENIVEDFKKLFKRIGNEYVREAGEEKEQIFLIDTLIRIGYNKAMSWVDNSNGKLSLSIDENGEFGIMNNDKGKFYKMPTTR